MSRDIIRYHYIIRILGVIAILGLIRFSDYEQNMYILMGLVVFYVAYNTAARFSLFIFKHDKYHVLNLFFDVVMLSIAIGVRGGLRSDFYLGYFLILGYVLFIRNKGLLFKLSAWIIVNYVVVVFLFSTSADLDVGRLIIRMTLLIGTALLLENYSKMLNEAETLREKAVNMAMFDSLTGVYNRRILEYLGELYESESVALYVVLLDIDNFKKINDKYGHPKGDEVLIALADEIQRSIDGDSICIRFGGEEFLILFQSNRFNEVRSIIKNVQQSIRVKRFNWLEDEEVITFTAGVSYRMEHENMDETIERADIALYNGKNNGKNCIELNENRLRS